METFHIYQKKPKGTAKPDRIDAFISLLPRGKENAITRRDLVNKCVEAGIVKASGVWENEDRSMRKLMERAKVDYKISITNVGDGKGYYRPTPEETIRLARNNNREDKKAVSTFRSNKINKALEEDFKHERVAGDA